MKTNYTVGDHPLRPLTEQVDKLIHMGRHVTIHELAVQMNCDHNAIHKMVEGLGYWKVCAKWVPQQVTPDLKERRGRMGVCSAVLEAIKTCFTDLWR